MNIPSWQSGVKIPWRDAYAVLAKEYITIVPIPIWKTQQFALGIIFRMSFN
ncbi:MAG: hypothetical protein HGA87_00080 [Desulfobulbaceae bacterium]|nr:hypothetical protein [Desulfobulbaceae bacterium]